jgi:hypothetical protein
MRRHGFAFLLAAFLPTATCTANALTTGFEDLALNTSFGTGQVINSNGLGFTVVNFPRGSNIAVTNAPSISAGGTGKHLFLGSMIGLDFHLPPAVTEVSFHFGDFSGARTGLIINGVPSPLGRAFANADGQMIGGVLVDALTSQTLPGGNRGRLTLQGLISSLIVGGTELALDDVSVSIVPEPSTFALAASTLVALSLIRRRRPL